MTDWTKTCDRCGSPVSADATVCPNCGASLGGVDSSVSGVPLETVQLDSIEKPPAPEDLAATMKLDKQPTEESKPESIPMPEEATPFESEPVVLPPLPAESVEPMAAPAAPKKGPWGIVAAACACLVICCCCVVIPVLLTATFFERITDFFRSF